MFSDKFKQGAGIQAEQGQVFQPGQPGPGASGQARSRGQDQAQPGKRARPAHAGDAPDTGGRQSIKGKGALQGRHEQFNAARRSVPFLGKKQRIFGVANDYLQTRFRGVQDEGQVTGSFRSSKRSGLHKPLVTHWAISLYVAKTIRQSNRAMPTRALYS